MFDPNNPGGGNNGFRDYLQGQGWDGQGMPFQYAQQLRQQGQHPRWDYQHPGEAFPGMGQQQGLGGLAGVGQWPQQMQMPAQGWAAGHGPQMGGNIPAFGGSYQNPAAPRPMYPSGYGQGIAQGEQNPSMGLMDLARRRATPYTPR